MLQPFYIFETCTVCRRTSDTRGKLNTGRLDACGRATELPVTKSVRAQDAADRLHATVSQCLDCTGLGS